MEELDSVLEIRQARLLPSSFLQSVIACLIIPKGAAKQVLHSSGRLSSRVCNFRPFLKTHFLEYFHNLIHVAISYFLERVLLIPIGQIGICTTL